MASNQAQVPESPQDIVFGSIVVDIDFHPVKNVLAAGDIDGEVTVHSYSTLEKNHLLMTLPHHKKACRALRFSRDGNTLYTASKDKSLCSIDMEKGALMHKIKKAHESALYSMLIVDNNILATGDDDGYLKVWDMRQRNAVMEIKENEEFISDMVIDNTFRYLLSTSGDGTLTCFDIRKHKKKMQSELFDSEMLSLALMKGEEKIAVGTGEGVINIFNWGEWGNISDRFPGHPMSIDCMLPINDSLMITGSFDGVIRAVHILPNRFVGVVGEHKDFPVENISICHDKKYIASCSHDQHIKFWNIENIQQEKVDTYRKKSKKNNKPKPLNAAAAASDFFADLADPKESSCQGSKTVDPDKAKTGTTKEDSDSASDFDTDEEDGSVNSEVKKKSRQNVDNAGAEDVDEDEESDFDSDDSDIDGAEEEGVIDIEDSADAINDSDSDESDNT